MWKNQGGKSVGLLPGRESLGPLFLMATTPVFIFVLWYTMYHLEGDFGLLIEGFKQVRGHGVACVHQWLGLVDAPIPNTQHTHTHTKPRIWAVHGQDGWSYLGEIIPTPFDPTAWKVILSYMAVELAFMRCVWGF